MTARLLVALVDEHQEYQRMQAEDARVAAERTGVQLDIVFAENNALVQIHQVFERIHAPEAERPQAIIVHPVTGGGIERVGKNAVKAGIGWIVLNTRVGYLELLRREHPDLPIASVTPDDLEIGRLQARQVRALVPAGGLLLYIQGPSDTSAARDRLQAAQQVLESEPFRWKILTGDWREAGGQQAFASWARLKTLEKPAVILAQNDAMAIGVRRAALAHDPSWAATPVVGCDALPDGGQRLVRSDELAATVVMPTSAGPAVDLVWKCLWTRKPPPECLTLAPRSYPALGQLRAR